MSQSQTQSYQTLIFIKINKEILLGKKNRGFGHGKWNGYGGKLENDECIFKGALRELHEESGLTLDKNDLIYLGYNEYKQKSDDFSRVVHIFTAEIVKGELKESEEMSEPCWFNFEAIPYENMWPDSKYWLPLIFEKRFFVGRFFYDENGNVESYDLEKLEKPPAIVIINEAVVPENS